MREKRLISVDELRAAGALDVPKGWRESLSLVTVKQQGMLWKDDPAPDDDPPSDQPNDDSTDEQADQEDEADA